LAESGAASAAGARKLARRLKTQCVFEIVMLAEAERRLDGGVGARARMGMQTLTRPQLLKYIELAAAEAGDGDGGDKGAVGFDGAGAGAAESAALAASPEAPKPAARVSLGVAAMLRRRAGAAQVTTNAVKAARAAAAAAAWAALPALTTADLRYVDPQQDTRRKPVLALRRGCLVLSLPPVRALIFTRRVLLFLENGADGDVEHTFASMRAWSAGRDDAEAGVLAVDPFVHAAFAATLGGTVSVLEGRVRDLAALVKESTAAGAKRRSAEVQFEYLQHGEGVCNEVMAMLEAVSHCVEAAAEAAGEAAEARDRRVEKAVAAALAAAEAGTVGEAAVGAAPSPRTASASASAAVKVALLARAQRAAADTPEPVTNSLLGLMDAGEDHLSEFSAVVGDLLLEVRTLQQVRARTSGQGGKGCSGGAASVVPGGPDWLPRQAVVGSSPHCMCLRLQRLDMERKRITVSLAKQRNTILRIGIIIQLATAVLGGCSVVSGEWCGWAARRVANSLSARHPILVSCLPLSGMLFPALQDTLV